MNKRTCRVELTELSKEDFAKLSTELKKECLITLKKLENNIQLGKQLKNNGIRDVSIKKITKAQRLGTYRIAELFCINSKDIYCTTLLCTVSGTETCTPLLNFFHSTYFMPELITSAIFMTTSKRVF